MKQGSKNFDFDQLLNQIPELKLLDCDIATISFDKPIDSSNMQPNDWVHMCHLIEENYSKHDGFVVLHGSDTMSYTASALSFMLENLSKPVILTGSQLPIGDLRTDAKENLITAVQLASLKNGTAHILQRSAFIFNTSFIVETEQLRQAQNILKLLPPRIICPSQLLAYILPLQTIIYALTSGRN